MLNYDIIIRIIKENVEFLKNSTGYIGHDLQQVLLLLDTT